MPNSPSPSLICSSADCKRPFAGPVVFCPFCGQKQMAPADAVVKTAKKEVTPPPLPASPRSAAVSQTPPPVAPEETPAPVADAVPAGKASEMADAVMRPPHVTSERIAKPPRNDWPLMLVLGAVVIGIAVWVLFLRDTGGNVEADPPGAQSAPAQEQVAQDAIADTAVSDAAASAQLQRGTAAYDSGDFATALAEMRPLAEQGNATAQNVLGFMYQNGKGVPQDDTQAVNWYRKAADQGDASGQNNLGFMYQNGKGVPQDDTQAVNWYRRAADQGNTAAQTNLGWMYHNGKGMPQDDEQAKYWLSKAAGQGHADARKLLDEIESSADTAESAIWQGTASDTVSPAITPSFDCTKASSDNEKLICSDQDLAAADLDANLAYRQAMAGTQDPELLKAQAKAAWKWREDYCHDKQCLLRWFASRKAQLQGGAMSGSAAATAAEPAAAPGATAARQLMQQCIANSRSLTTPAGSKVALSESEAAQYCNCARQQNGTLAGGIPATVGNHCLNQL